MPPNKKRFSFDANQSIESNDEDVATAHARQKRGRHYIEFLKKIVAPASGSTPKGIDDPDLAVPPKEDILSGITYFNLLFKNSKVEKAYQEYFHNTQIRNLYQTRMCLTVFTVLQMATVGGYFSCGLKLPVVFVGSCESLLQYLYTYLIILTSTLFISTFTESFKRNIELYKISYALFNGIGILLTELLVSASGHSNGNTLNNILFEGLTVALVLLFIYITSICGVGPRWALPLLVVLSSSQIYIAISTFSVLSIQLFHISCRISEFLIAVYIAYSWEKCRRYFWYSWSRVIIEEEKLTVEKMHVERLLFSLLPRRIAEKIIQIQQDPSIPQIIAEDEPNAVVMFARICGFDDAVSEHDISLLSQVFCAFDEACEDSPIKKIKSIGPTVLYAGGIGEDISVDSMLEFALKLFLLLKEFNSESGYNFQLRVGIARGPVVAGVIGYKRPKFDIWGDTVNTASRMETTGIPGTIQFTENLMQEIKEDFNVIMCSERYIKGKGKVRTFYIKPLKDIPQVEENVIRKTVEGSKRRSSFSHYFEKPKLLPTVSITDPTSFTSVHPPSINIFSLTFTNPKIEQEYHAWLQTHKQDAILLAHTVACFSYGFTSALFISDFNTSHSYCYVAIIVLLGYVLSILFAASPWFSDFYQSFSIPMRFIVQSVGLWVIYKEWIDPIPISYFMFVLTEGIICFHLVCQRWKIAVLHTIYENIAFVIILCYKQVPNLMLNITMLLAFSLYSCYTHYRTELHVIESFHYTKVLKLQSRQLKLQKEASDNLLLSILPKFIVEKLKQRSYFEKIVPEQPNDSYLSYPMQSGEVTLLIADIVDFTKLCSSLTAIQVVSILDKIFVIFDKLCAQYQTTKIKTIGDAMVIVANLEDYQEDHAERIIDLGLKMIEEVRHWGENNEMGVKIRIRVGIHSGPIFAGVMKTQNFSFDVWGNTAAIAELHEITAKPDTVNISEQTLKYVRDKYEVEKGVMVTYKDYQSYGYRVCKKYKTVNKYL